MPYLPNANQLNLLVYTSSPSFNCASEFIIHTYVNFLFNNFTLEFTGS